jgi:phosphoribosyl-dephospho-CoA transferase
MFSRHELVWLSGAGWQAARTAALPAQQAAIERWQREDWPAIVRRNDADTGADTVCLGIALAPAPSDGSKQRIALRALKADVVRTLAALPLRAVLDAAPAAWQAGLAALDAQAQRLTIRVYGSLALQALTGQPYVTPSSDIDLLFYPATLPELRAGLALLSAHAASLPLDGEVVFPSGDAVAWKEWIDAQRHNARVLVKHNSAVRLADTRTLLETLAP